MNKTFAEGVELAREVNDYVRYKEGGEGVLVVLGTPFIHLAKVAHNITESSIMVAAQNCATEKAGAYTGEISAEMIASTGAKCVILGHSERRSYYGETSPILVKKVAQALESKLEIIFCVGEVLEERETEKHFEVVKQQLTDGLFNLAPEQFAHVVIAYEPVWAIGTGKSASQDDAQKMCKVVRDVVAADFGQEVADKVRVLYGGSVKPENVAEYMACPDVDGALVGGASLEPESFLALLDFVK